MFVFTFEIVLVFICLHDCLLCQTEGHLRLEVKDVVGDCKVVLKSAKVTMMVNSPEEEFL